MGARSALKGQPKLKHDALTGRVYETIKAAILDMKVPPGARLNIDQLARDLGVSISPIRESLARLLSERLVVFKPYSGYVVAALPDKKFYVDLVETRILLESYAARIGAPRRDPGILKVMRQAIQELERVPLGQQYKDYGKWSVRDARLHGAVIESAGNVALLQVYHDLHPHLHFARLYHLQEEIDRARVLGEHRRIVEAFEAGDAEAAVEAIKQHLEYTRETLNLVKSFDGP